MAWPKLPKHFSINFGDEGPLLANGKGSDKILSLMSVTSFTLNRNFYDFALKG